MDLLSYMMGRKSAGGGGGSDAIVIDCTKFGNKTINNASYSSEGASLKTTGSYIMLPATVIKNVVFEIDVASMQLTSGQHRRFVSDSSGNGLIYRDNGKWAFYSSNWEETNITDGNYFDNCTVKIYVDNNNKWHIYKDDVLIFEPSLSLKIGSSGLFVGNQSYSINNALITAIRINPYE